MNVVLIAYHYPPDPAVGSLRPAKVAKALRDAGQDVTVITACMGGEAPGVRHTEPGLTITAVKPYLHPRAWYARLKKRRSRSAVSAAVTPAVGPDYVRPKGVAFWKRAVFSFLWLPDDRQGFIVPAIRAALPLLRLPGSVLYTTAPPFSTHIAGWWLRKRTRARWVAEFRDPWSDNPWKPGHVRTTMTDAIERTMERRVLGAADLVVAVSRGIQRVFQPKMAGRDNRLVLIRNGIDNLLPPVAGASPSSGPVRIVHVGSFYHGRDPRPFLRAVAAVRTNLNLNAGHLRIELVGQSRWFAGESMEKAVEALGLSDIVQFQDWVPHSTAQELILSADALLLLAQDQPDQVPNKLYEYLGTRRVILAYVDEEGESASMLREVGGHYLVTGHDPSLAEKAIAQLVARTRPAESANETTLGEWTTEAQMRHLISRIGGL